MELKVLQLPKNRLSLPFFRLPHLFSILSHIIIKTLAKVLFFDKARKFFCKILLIFSLRKRIFFVIPSQKNSSHSLTTTGTPNLKY